LARELLGIEAQKEAERIITFIRRTVRAAPASGVVVGLSGGIDSAVVASLCAKAVGPEKVLALLLPSDHTPKKDIEDALNLAVSLGARRETIPISRIVGVITNSAAVEGTRIARANVEARVRMSILYYHANSLGYLVAGTGDRSESLLGYFTKWGDGGVDFMPIAHLYKTQVRDLGTYLGLPKGVVEKPSSPQLWPGHKASDEIPAEYDKLDLVLHFLFDLKATPARAAREARVLPEVVDKVLDMHKRTAHKRNTPPTLG
jgi:NAD+ synthase